MRVALLIAVLIAAVGCGAGTSATAVSAAATELRITYWPEGRAAGGATKWTLRCVPSGGTLPRPGVACRKLTSLKNPFAPIPRGAICTDQYGGPQVALIAGSFRGGKVWTLLQNRNGCEIARFQRLAFLVPAFGAGASS